MVQLLRFLDVDPQDILPQRHPFIMIDRLTHYDEVVTSTSLLVSSHNIFVEKGRMLATGLIENMAQTGAARMGYINLYVNHGKVVLGFIGEVKRLAIHRLPRVGECVETTVEVRSEVLSTLLVQATMRAGGEVVAEGSMKICMAE